MIGKITIELEGIGFPETERCRAIIHSLFEQGVFNVRNGKAILNFDSDGTLAEIEFNVKKWKRNKESLATVLLYEKVKVETSP